MNIRCTKCNSIVVEYYGCANKECSCYADKDEPVGIVFRKREVEDILKAIKSGIDLDFNKEEYPSKRKGYVIALGIINRIAEKNNLNIK